jgi:hypothetical protein
VIVTLRLLAAALIAQLMFMTPPLGNAASSHGANLALVCGSTGASPEALAALAELLDGVGHEPAPAHNEQADHCPACALAKAIALPDIAAARPILTSFHIAQSAARIDRVSPRQTVGPPVGLRAPPLIA